MTSTYGARCLHCHFNALAQTLIISSASVLLLQSLSYPQPLH